jgi:hypothetical protein
MSDLGLLLEIRSYFLCEVASNVQEILKQERPRRDLGFGDDTILKNIWEEYCIQEQFEEGDFFNEYETHIRILILKEIEELPNTIQKLLIYIGRLEFQKREAYEDEEQVIGYANNFNYKAILKILNESAGRYRNTDIKKYENLDLPEGDNQIDD